MRPPLPEAVAREVLRQRQEGTREKIVARSCGVSISMVRAIKRGDRWAHLTAPPDSGVELTAKGLRYAKRWGG